MEELKNRQKLDTRKIKHVQRFYSKGLKDISFRVKPLKLSTDVKNL